MNERTSLEIAEIEIGERRREDMGDIAGLAESIQRFGLFHPIVVDGGGRLVAGGRRLAACQQLGWESIPVRDLGDLTDAERREIELEENLRRKDLTPYEISKTEVKLVETVAEVLRQDPPEFSPELRRNPLGGRPQKPDSQERIAARLKENGVNLSQQEISKAEQHVETAEHYPFMQRPEWKQSHVLDARRYLSDIPDEHRPAVAALLDEPGIPPVVAIPMLRNLASLPDDDRTEIVALSKSNDERDKSLAKTRAANLPPMPDPQTTACFMARRSVGSALKLLRSCFRDFPTDPAAPRFRALVETLDGVDIDLEDLERDLRAAHSARTKRVEVA